MSEKGYEFPTYDDRDLDLRTDMLTNLLISMDMQNSMRVITDMAFNSIDLDGSDSLDVTEIKDIMDQIADEIRISPPTLDDLEAIIREIDEDFDG